MFLSTSDLKNQEIYLSLYKTADENKEKGYVLAYYFNIVRCIDDVAVAKKHNMDEVFITCSPENIASRRTCELSGGVLIDILDIPIWHEMYEMGRRQACQYVVRI